ncbi:hypothetical protein WJX84_004791 [Apatococcus fuscideae]|uniref:Pop1 N-terminal domain-containing protein n=1 Tax=Apatococcus fuscideae TaxID=2026836 RepID=A0AAW1ST84_9CHLO
MAGEDSVPRVLEVQKFVGARDAEVRALKAILTDTPSSKDTWGEGSQPRHLRRRTASHKRFHRQRRPNVKLQSARQPKPGESQADADIGQPLSLLNRRMRRKRSWLQAAAERSSQQLAEQQPGTSTAGSDRMHCQLETHLWHAKRFRMANRWDHVLAEGQCGAGKGSRSLLNKLRTGCVLHDASYHVPIEIAGSKADLSLLLLSVCPAGDVQKVLNKQAFWAGRSEVALMLHHPGAYPSGAIAPMCLLCTPAEPHPQGRAHLRALQVYRPKSAASPGIALPLAQLAQRASLQQNGPPHSTCCFRGLGEPIDRASHPLLAVAAGLETGVGGPVLRASSSFGHSHGRLHHHYLPQSQIRTVQNAVAIVRLNRRAQQVPV